MRAIVSKMPEPVKAFLRQVKTAVNAVRYYGNNRYCPICGRSSRKFLPYGVVPRDDVCCVYCGSLERHRLLWLFISRKTSFFDGNLGKKMLHVAPELCLEPKFRQYLGANYITADLFNPRAMVKMDVSDIEFPDQYFDVIYCSHVLEHVPDDRKAMQEFHRTLKDDGWAILLVPITAEKTLEDPSITDPAERLRAFGQEDHVRRYGPDYADRLRESGFNVELFTIDNIARADEANRMRLIAPNSEIFFCTKQIDSR